MAKPNSLNRYLAGTPYAVLSMESLEPTAFENLQLSLENELTKIKSLREQLTRITGQKGMCREIALSLESIDDSILPFKPVGFTAFPSKTGLTLTQESLGRAIAEGFKRAIAFLLELLKRFGALIATTLGLAPRAKAVSEETKIILARYSEAKEIANIIVTDDVNPQAAKETSSFNFNGRDYLSLIRQADTVGAFFQIMHRWNSYCRSDLNTIQTVLRNFSNPNKAAIAQIEEAVGERADTLARAMQREHITANPSDDLGSFKKSYFTSLDEFILPRRPRPEKFTAKDLASKFVEAGNLLAVHSAEFASLSEGFSKSIHDIERQISRNMNMATEAEHAMFTNMHTLIAIHSRMVSVLATHVAYLIQTQDAYNRKASADLESAKTKGDVE